MESTTIRTAALIAALISSFAFVVPSQADQPGDHDRARQALEAGEILPLRKVLERVERDTPGQVMEVDLERKHGRWIYEIKLLRTNGLLSKLRVDASSGALISLKDKD